MKFSQIVSLIAIILLVQGANSSISSVFSGAASIIQQAASTWQDVVGAFKSSKNQTLEQTLAGQGFDHFAQSAQTQMIGGLMQSFLPTFLQQLATRLEVPADKQQDFIDVCQDIMYEEETTWSAYNIFFNKGTSSSIKYATIMMNHNSTDSTVNFLLADMQATFELAPNVMVIGQQASYAGGIWSSNTIKFKDVPQSLTEDDITEIFDFFYIISLKELGQLVGVNLTFPSLAPPSDNSISSVFSGAASIIQQAASTWQDVVGAFKSSKNQTLEQTLAGQGFDHFAQSAQTQMIGGLMQSFLPTFLQQLATRLEVPADKQQDFIDVCQDIMYEEETTWSAYNIFFNKGTSSSIKYATIMMNHNSTDSTVNFLLADMQATFELAPNVMVIGQQASYAGGIWSSNTIKFKDVPQSLTEDDITEIFDFFYIVSLKELGQLVGVNLTFPSLAPPSDNSISSVFSGAASIIQQAASTWQDVVGAFKSSKNQTLEQTLAGQGFDHFAQSAQTQMIGGLMQSFLPTFLQQLATRLEVPADKQQDFIDVCQDIMYEEETTWSAYNIFFNKGTSSSIKYATIMMNHNSTDSTVNFLLADMQATFELAPNVMVIGQQASYAGGIWSSNTIKFKDVPQSLTEDDITEIFDFFYIISLKELGQLVGVNLTFPSLAPPSDNSISSVFSGAASIIQQAASTWQDVVGAFKSSKNQTLEQTLAGQGFDHFAQSAQTQMIGGLMQSFLPTFLQQLATRLEVPADKQQDFIDVCQDIMYEEETTWSAYNIFFNKGTSSSIKYATIMMNHNSTDSTVNFLLADMQATFELAPNVMVIGQQASYAGGIWSSNTIKFKDVPQSLTEDDITEIFDFFYIVSLKELGQLVGVNLTFPSLAPPSDNSISSVFSGAASIIQQAASTWQDVVGAFKSSKNQTLEQTLAGQGFDHFAQSAQTQMIGGLMQSFLPTFLQQLATRLEVPADKQQDFIDVCQDIMYEEETTWSAYNIFFNKGTSSSIKYATIMMNHNSTDSTVNFLLADMQATFELAPNVMVIGQQASYAGGIWSSNTIKFKDVPQSLTEDDITEIFDFFYIISLKELGQLVGVNLTFPSLAPPSDNSISSVFSGAASIIQQAASTWQDVVGAFKSSKNQTLEQTLAGQGFDHFAQSAQTQMIGGLMQSFLPTFLQQLATRLEVPADKQQDFIDVCQDIMYEEETTWSAYNIFFNKGTSSSIKYATIMMNHNSTDSTVNFLLADMQATFELAPNVMVIGQQASYAGGIWSSNTIKFKDVPQSLTEDDITEIFDFFYIVSLKELGQLVGVNLTFPSLAPPSDNSISSVFSGAASIIQQAASTWQDVVGAFKSSKNQTLEQTLAGQGFDHFAQSAQTQMIGGLMQSFLPTFLQQLATRLEVPADKQQDFIDVCQDIMYEEETTWSAYNIFFNKGTSSSIKYATIMMNHNSTDSTVNFLLADMQATFELAPNVMVIGQQASYAGGIWSSNTIKFKDVPQSLTEDDITEIFDFFYIVSLKELGQLVGVNLTFPSLAPPTIKHENIQTLLYKAKKSK